LDFACPREIAFLIEILGAAVEARQRWCAEFPTLEMDRPASSFAENTNHNECSAANANAAANAR
jgi:hypothetical protein